MSKTFTYSENGIAYTVTVYEDEHGAIKADITVTEGSMDVNAFYWAIGAMMTSPAPAPIWAGR